MYTICYANLNFAFLSSKLILHFHLDPDNTNSAGSPVADSKSLPDVVFVISHKHDKTKNGLEKLHSMFEMTNPSSGGDVPTPKKNVTSEIPEDIKQMYANDPELENCLKWKGKKNKLMVQKLPCSA